MRLDDCSEFRGHKLKNCSRCGHQFDVLKLTRLNCDQLNAIKDKEWQFGFKWKLSDWAVGEVIKVDVCQDCYSSIVNLIDANEQVDKLTIGYSSEHPDLLPKQINIPMYRCPICHGELSKDNFVNIPHYLTSDILVHPCDYFLRWSRSEKQAFLEILSKSIGYSYVKVCKHCFDGLFHEYLSNEAQRIKKETDHDTEHHKLPVYINGEYHGEVYEEPYRVDMVDAAMYTYEKLKNKMEERKMKNVNETKNQNHAFAIERNYDETDRKLFRLEDAETGDFIRLATDEDRLIYMVVNIAPVKNRVKVNEKSESNCIWCVCIQTQDLVALNSDEMVYVYDPRYIAFHIGRFIDE